jgi:hypothetical protein
LWRCGVEVFEEFIETWRVVIPEKELEYMIEASEVDIDRASIYAVLGAVKRGVSKW